MPKLISNKRYKELLDKEVTNDLVNYLQLKIFIKDKIIDDELKESCRMETTIKSLVDQAKILGLVKPIVNHVDFKARLEISHV